MIIPDEIIGVIISVIIVLLVFRILDLKYELHHQKELKLYWMEQRDKYFKEYIDTKTELNRIKRKNYTKDYYD